MKVGQGLKSSLARKD